MASLLKRLRFLYYLVFPLIKQNVKKLKIVNFIKGKGNISIVDKKNLNSDKIDHLGRYDNCIKPGDEEFWLKKFKNINFV